MERNQQSLKSLVGISNENLTQERKSAKKRTGAVAALLIVAMVAIIIAFEISAASVYHRSEK